MSPVVKAILILAMFIVLGVLVYEIRAWKAGTRIVSRKQKALRFSSAILMIIILTMILCGGIVDAYGPIAVMVYWIIAFCLATILVMFAMLDIRQVGIQWTEQRKNNYERLVNKDDERRDES